MSSDRRLLSGIFLGRVSEMSSVFVLDVLLVEVERPRVETVVMSPESLVEALIALTNHHRQALIEVLVVGVESRQTGGIMMV